MFCRTTIFWLSYCPQDDLACSRHPTSGTFRHCPLYLHLLQPPNFPCIPPRVCSPQNPFVRSIIFSPARTFALPCCAVCCAVRCHRPFVGLSQTSNLENIYWQRVRLLSNCGTNRDSVNGDQWVTSCYLPLFGFGASPCFLCLQHIDACLETAGTVVGYAEERHDRQQVQRILTPLLIAANLTFLRSASIDDFTCSSQTE